MLVAIQERYTFFPDSPDSPNWYRKGEVCTRVMEYYFLLRLALRDRPDLLRCLTRCRHCRIFFLSDPRNRGRKDLGCPFGCQDALRKKSSTQRSTDYYRTPAGKAKKARINSRRRKLVEDAARDEVSDPAQEAAGPDVPEFDPGIVEHVRVVVSLVERSLVSREEVVAMLEMTVRQHSIVRERRQDYILRWLAEHPP